MLIMTDDNSVILFLWFLYDDEDWIEANKYEIFLRSILHDVIKVIFGT